jgi:hypothetical protein
MEAGKNDCKPQVLITGAELHELNVSGNRSACRRRPGSEQRHGCRRRLSSRLGARLPMGVFEKLTNVIEIALTTPSFVPKPYRFPDTLQAEDQFSD